MGVLPLQFPDGESVESLGLTGEETFDLAPLEEGARTLKVTTDAGVAFDARVRIDTPNEWQYLAACNLARQKGSERVASRKGDNAQRKKAELPANHANKRE